MAQADGSITAAGNFRKNPSPTTLSTLSQAVAVKDYF
jgi:hypothetical protein